MYQCIIILTSSRGSENALIRLYLFLTSLRGAGRRVTSSDWGKSSSSLGRGLCMGTTTRYISFTTTAISDSENTMNTKQISLS